MRKHEIYFIVVFTDYETKNYCQKNTSLNRYTQNTGLAQATFST